MELKSKSPLTALPCLGCGGLSDRLRGYSWYPLFIEGGKPSAALLPTIDDIAKQVRRSLCVVGR